MFPLYVCDKCGQVDLVEMGYPSETLPKPALCTVCQGRVWHNQIPQRAYDPKRDLPVNRPTGVGLG